MNKEIKEILDNWKYVIDNKITVYGETIAFKQIKILLDYITNLQEEINRLNNIIDELEKWLKEKQDLTCGCGITRDYLYAYENVLDELNELKGDNK